MNDIEPEDLKRIDDFAQEFATYADQQNGDHSYNESAYTDFKLGAEYEHRYMAAKQDELVEWNTKMKQFIENFIDHTSSGYDGDALIWALRTEAALTKTPKP